MEPINLNTPTEKLLKDLFDIQKVFNKLGIDEKHKKVISDIGLKAFNDYYTGRKFIDEESNV